MERLKAVFNWSGGKDSAHALWRAMQSGRYEVVALLTTSDRGTGRSTLHGIRVVEPLGELTPDEAMRGFLRSGLRTVVVTTLDGGPGREAIGREVDAAFVASLPAGCDPNGGNGEYHTFCYDGPIFRTPVRFRLGEPVRSSYKIGLEDGSTATCVYWTADLRAAED